MTTFYCGATDLVMVLSISDLLSAPQSYICTSSTEVGDKEMLIYGDFRPDDLIIHWQSQSFAGGIRS